ncbi:hypothetical protein [Solirubrobacter deserti]|uniref:Uncharacterized protein n=1 Tax=Solirubrobacter deserti TaxID=2282478 RepID=A0ABT4RF63_9ACTN|nr:hypothetical protein [Solirubrobacter deserti]MDA0137001.1 hypothetical protein [Solirubrobacter deserti]
MSTTLSRLLLVALTITAFAGLSSSANAQTPWQFPYWSDGETLKLVAMPGSSMKIVDDEWGADEVQIHDLYGTVFGPVGSLPTYKLQSFSRCTGDEVRGAVYSTVTAAADHQIRLKKLRLELYEGQNCAAPIMKDYIQLPYSIWFDAYDSHTVTLYAKNYMDGDDSITLTLKLKAYPQVL